MRHILKPKGPEEREERTGGHEAPGTESGPVVRWYPREGASWWKGLRAVLSVLDTASALKQNEALALAARALIAVGDLIVDAGKHERS
ncbi:hypothetical protein A8W25_01050 [Streptomyces sp. ERV7]|nr:hypothetical protein A8W25_01050 [Streptomyces sp. ERV7]